MNESGLTVNRPGRGAKTIESLKDAVVKQDILLAKVNSMIPKTLHDAIKIIAIQDGVTLNDLVTRIFQGYIESRIKP